MVFVASPIAMGSTPVASGSRVPACPTFALVLRRMSWTTRLELIPSGLSMTSQPCGPLSILIAIALVLHLQDIGMEVACYVGAYQQCGDALGLFKGSVERKVEVGSVAQRHFPGQEPLQEWRAPLERRESIGGVGTG